MEIVLLQVIPLCLVSELQLMNDGVHVCAPYTAGWIQVNVIIHLYCVNYYGLCNVHYFEKCIVLKHGSTIIAQ